VVNISIKFSISNETFISQNDMTYSHKPHNFITDPILVTWQSTVYEPPEDGFKKRLKHVGASVKCFYVNFSAF